MITPKFWSKLESESDITSPQIGTGGTPISSPPFNPGKFNNGMEADNGIEGFTLPAAANSINVDKGAVEFWFKPFFLPNANGYKDIIYGLGTRRIRIYFHPTIDDFAVEIGTGGFILESSFSWSINDLIHFGITWDREGNDIGGGKTCAFYINNVEVDSTTLTWTAGALPANLQIGWRDVSYYAEGVIDNLKFYDECKTDFSDGGREGVEEVFGNTFEEAVAWSTGGQVNHCKFTSGSAGTLEKLSVYVEQSGAGTPVTRCHLYDAARNKVANGETEELEVEDAQDGWMHYDFLVPPTVAAATVYWLAWFCEPAAGAKIFHGVGDANQAGATAGTYPTFPATLNAGSIAWLLSMYCTYAGAPPPPSVKSLVQATLISLAPLIAIPTLGQILKYAGG